MKWKLIIVQLIIIVILIGAYFATRESQVAATASERANEPLIRNLPLDRVASIEISKGEEKVVLKKQSDPEKSGSEEKWVLASAWDAEANNERVKEFIDEMRLLKRGHFRGDNPRLLEKYGLDEKERTTILFKDAKDRTISSVILGRTTFSMADFASLQDGRQRESTSTTYVLLPGTTTVHEIPGSHHVSAARTYWANLKIVDMDTDDISLVQIQSEKHQFALVRRIKESSPQDTKPPEEGEPPDKKKEEKKEYEWFIHLGKGKEPIVADDGKVQSLLSTLAHLSASDIVEPMKIQPGNEEADAAEMARYGFDKEKLFVSICTPREGDEQPVLRHLLQFGKGPGDDEYYLHSPRRRSGFFEAIFSALADDPEQFVEKIPVYKISKWCYDSVNKAPADFEKTPEKEPEGPPAPTE